MTKLGTTITTTKQIMTPGGHPLRPFDEFEREKMRENLDARLDECRYMRQTGRTTRMVIEALELAIDNPGRHIVILTLNNANGKHINSLLQHYMTQYGLDKGTRGGIHVLTANEPPIGVDILRKFVDNVITDTQDLKKTTLNPATNLVKGQHVNILVKNVWIKRIEYAGGGSDAYQYIGQTPNGVEIAFADDSVICVNKDNQKAIDNFLD
jgi:hypothetical protein